MNNYSETDLTQLHQELLTIICVYFLLLQKEGKRFYY